MKHLLKTILATSALVTIAGTASAGDGFETKFPYDRTAPVEITYASFLEITKATCRVEAHRSTARHSITQMRRFRIKCERILMDQVVNKTGSPTLTALHHANTGKKPARTMLTQAKLAAKPQP